MGELNEGRWAVLSERGCEARRLAYADAERVMKNLARERVSGLCVITDDAAGRLSADEKSLPGQSDSNGTRPKRSPATGKRR